jgi:hypothetical protein
LVDFLAWAAFVGFTRVRFAVRIERLDFIVVRPNGRELIHDALANVRRLVVNTASQHQAGQPGAALDLSLYFRCIFPTRLATQNIFCGLVTPIRACGPAGGQVARGMKKISHKGYRFPLEIIQQAIWAFTSGLP